MEEDFYKVLGVDRNASAEEIKKGVSKDCLKISSRQKSRK